MIRLRNSWQDAVDAGSSPARIALVTFAALVAVVTSVVSIGSDLRAQDGRGRMFSLPRSQDDTYELRQAREDLAAGAVVEAVERLHVLLAKGRPGVVPADETSDRWIGLRHAVIATLRSLPAAGREAYERLTLREAGPTARTAFVGHRPRELGWLAQTFPTAEVGLRARLRLGDLALEAGQGDAALGHYRAALDATPDDDPLRSLLQRRLAAAEVLVGSDSRRTPKNGGDDVGAVTADVESVLVGTAAERALTRGWPAYGGGGVGTFGMRGPSGRPQPIWQQDIRPRGIPVGTYSMHAVGSLAGIYVNDGIQLHALDPLTGRQQWIGEGPLTDERSNESDSLNPSITLTAAFANDVVVAALQVPIDSPSIVYRNISVLNRLPARRLYAFDRTTGKRVWSHFDRLDGPVARRFRGHDVCGAPLVEGDTVYVATQDQTGAIAFYLTAYDLKTGTPRWRRLVCSSQQEVNMFGNARFEFVASPLATAGGVVYGVTNLGVAFAADAATGELRWVTAYPVTDLPQTRLTNQRPREVYFANNPVVVTDGVMAATPLDSAFVVGIDVDTGRLLWLFDYTAAVRDQNEVRWLLGAIDDEFILSGRGIVAAKARPTPRSRPYEAELRQIVSPDRLGLGTDKHYWLGGLSRGAIADGLIWLPAPDGLQVFDRRGDLVPRTGDLRDLGPNLGNLLMVDGLLFSVRNGPVEGSFHIQSMLAEAERAVRSRPDDPVVYLRRAELLRATGGDNPSSAMLEETERSYRQGLEAATRAGLAANSDVHRRLATGLLEMSLAHAEVLARRDPNAATALLRRARDGARAPSDWLRVQERILVLLTGDTAAYLAELDAMVAAHGNATHSFADAGEMPVAAYALWQRARRAAPAAAVAACQELIERFPSVTFAGAHAREFAIARQRELIAEHGEGVYRAIEARAAEDLAAAGREPDALRTLTLRHPNSAAARTAAGVLMDLAVERGDVLAAAEAFGKALGEAAPATGILRRMAEAARRAGNRALAQRIAARLVAQHGRERSDFAADGGRTFAEALADASWTEPLTATPPPRPTRLPTDVVAQLPPRLPGALLQFLLPSRVVGFAAPADVPLYVVSEGEQLLAYDLPTGATFGEPLFALALPSSSDDETRLLHLCGESLIVAERTLVRAIHYRTGEERWRHTADGTRLLRTLGFGGGLLHLFSEHPGQGDGGQLLTLEPTTGVLFRRFVFPARRESRAPMLSGSEILIFETGSAAEPRGTPASSAQVLGLDPLTGTTTMQVTIPADTLEKLGLRDSARRSLRAASIQDLMFADANAVYLAVEDLTRGPAVAAIRRDGRELWTWRGTAQRTLRHFAPSGERVVVLESGSNGSHLVQLHRTSGQPESDRRFEANARVLNWRRGSPVSPSPSPLLIAEQEGATQSLTCLSSDGSQPSFRHRVPALVDFLAEAPVFGDGFLALPGHHRSNPNLMVLQVLDPQTRSSLLPSGESYRSFELGPPLRLAAFGEHVLVQSQNGLSVLGQKEKSR